MELLSAEEVADVLKKSKRWVKDHYAELGGFYLGRDLRFFAEGLEEALRRAAAEQAEERKRARPEARPLGARHTPAISEATVKSTILRLREDARRREA